MYTVWNDKVLETVLLSESRSMTQERDEPTKE